MNVRRSLIKNDYANLQEEYMDGVHIPDFKAADKLWDTTLYRPLKEYLSALIDETTLKAPSLVYIGAGPEAPAFFEKNSNSKIGSRIKGVLLVDVSNRYLAAAKKKIQEAYPLLKVTTACIDITGGFGQVFALDLMKLIEGANSLSDLLNNIPKLTSYAHSKCGPDILMTDSKDIPEKLSKAGDIVYSELLATFTGTAAMFKMEKSIVEKLGVEIKFHKEWATTKAELQSLWRRYNDLSYLYQLDTMSRLVKRNGLVAIATDTEKKFEDSTHKSIFSFSGPSFPSLKLSRLVKLESIYNKSVWWEDSLRSHSSALNAESTVEALLPHKHKIEFATYKCLA